MKKQTKEELFIEKRDTLQGNFNALTDMFQELLLRASTTEQLEKIEKVVNILRTEWRKNIAYLVVETEQRKFMR